MVEILLHPRVKNQIAAFTANPVHALLVTGPAGSGKTTAARAIGATLLDIDSGSALDSYPYFLHLAKPAGKQEITIEQVRELNRQLRLKAPGSRDTRRVVLVEDAQLMSHEAQNALLKNLEEPASDIVFILTAPSDRSVLPTIASRSRQLYIPPVSLTQAKRHFAGQYTEADIASAWELSRGGAGLLNAIVAGNKAHPLNNSVEQAKKFLKAEPYERLLIIDELNKGKQDLMLFLDALGRVVAALHKSAALKGRQGQERNLLKSRELIDSLQSAMEDNASSRLVGLRLVLSLRV